MTAFRGFLAKEFLEIRKTWRIWVVPGIAVFLAAVSPIVAAVAPSLVKLAAGSQPGVVIELPDPVALDAYLQFLKNMNQIVLIAVIIAGAGMVSRERQSGTAALVLTKPLSRTSFVLAKLVSHQSLLAAVTVVATGVCVGVTTIVFGPSPVGRFVASVAVWLVLAMLMVTLMTFLSVVLPSQGGAAGVGLAAYFAMAILSAWPAAAKYSFAGLASGTSAVLTGRSADLLWPLGTAALLAAALGAGAVAAFQRQEL